MVTARSVLSITFSKNIKDSRKLYDLFDFRNLNRNHLVYSIKNEKVIRKFRRETPKNCFIDEFNSLRGKAYSFFVEVIKKIN